MFPRLLNIPEKHSFFLFGARGTGKSSLLKEHFQHIPHLFIDLLEDKYDRRYQRQPDLLLVDIQAAQKKQKISWVIIDEIQKVPKLLDLVHKSIESEKIYFALTGSSARKLKRGGANLLAGRAFLYHLFPLTFQELGEQFSLEQTIMWGSLPKIYSLDNDSDKKNFLKSYVKSYIQEEILLEQIIRNINGFQLFLEVAAQMNGRPLNFSKMAREVGLDAKTIKEYFQILEDTLIGFWLPGFHQSLRKSQTFIPKFYFFDLGVTRYLDGSMSDQLNPRSTSFGHYFEHYIMAECFRLNQYTDQNFRMSHYQVTGGGEIDLILSKGQKRIAVEIKSTTKIDPTEVRSLARYALPFGPKCEKYYVSQDPFSNEIEGVQCLFYKDFLRRIFN